MNQMTDREVLEQIRDLTMETRTIHTRLSLRDHLKHLFEQQGIWGKGSGDE